MMVVACWYDHTSPSEPQVGCYGGAGTAEVLLASLLLVDATHDVRRGFGHNQARGQTGDLELEPGTTLQLEKGDVLIAVRWQTVRRLPNVDYTYCELATAGQLHTASVVLDELARHGVRRILTAAEVKAAEARRLLEAENREAVQRAVGKRS